MRKARATMKNRGLLLFGWEGKQKAAIGIIMFFIATTCLQAQQLAFPGAEGYGRYTTGGRGGEVIEVTNLNDSGSGSLRAAIQTYGARTIVFRVSGTIALNQRLNISYGDVTIAGQTAPGDGICIKNGSLIVDAYNVIIRYIRVRPGDENPVGEWDCISGTDQKDVIVDHCSTSWSIDECLSLYDIENLTIQWCLISESLYDSYHSKGPHGYGGIWGGMGASFHHNMFVHHSSRNPRFQGARYNSTPETEIVDYRNNVVFNWGFNSAYGGEEGNQNVIGNYYKAGPATSGSVRDRIVNPSDDKGKWYVTDNYVYGYPAITADNWDGGVQGWPAEKIKADTPIPFVPVVTYNAEQAYKLVLANAGAVLPKRDAVDARVVEDVRTGTATYGGTYGAGTGIIDSQSEVGGWPVLNSETPPVDDDHDGMADEWENAQGLNPTDPEDRNGDINGDGYTNLENYINSLCVRDDFVLPVYNLKAEGISFNQIDLTWQENALAEAGISIERSANDTTNFVEIATVAAGDTSYDDLDCSPATTYYYRVRSFNQQSTYSIYSLYVTAITNYADGRPGEASEPDPSDNATDIENTQILMWTPGTAAESHDIYLGTNNPPEFLENTEDPFYDPRGLLDGTTYYWRIDEVNASGTTAGPVWQFTTLPFEEGLEGHWAFDRGYGNVDLDLSGNRNYAYLNNMAAEAWVEGFSGSALQFDGQDDYVYIENSESIDMNIRGFTLSFWIRLNNADHAAPWISKGINPELSYFGGYEVESNNEGQVVFRVADDVLESSVSVINTDFTADQWVWVCAVRDRSTGQIALYVNGSLKASAEDSTYNLSQRGKLFIGTSGEMDRFFNGAIDDVRLYNYAFTQEEIENLYQEYLSGIDDFMPGKYILSVENYPNPFNACTKVVCTIPAKDFVTLSVYNVMGQEIKRLFSGQKQRGEYEVVFDAANLQSGVYFFRLSSGQKTVTNKMLVLK